MTILNPSTSLKTWNQLSPALDVQGLLTSNNTSPDWEALNSQADESTYARALAGLGAWLAAPLVMSVLGFMLSLVLRSESFISLALIGLVCLGLGIWLERVAGHSAFAQQFSLIACVVGIGFLGFHPLGHHSGYNHSISIGVLIEKLIFCGVMLVGLCLSHQRIQQGAFALALVGMLCSFFWWNSASHYLGLAMCVALIVLVLLAKFQTHLVCTGWAGQQQALLVAVGIAALVLSINWLLGDISFLFNKAEKTSPFLAVLGLGIALGVAIIGKYCGNKKLPSLALITSFWYVYILYFSTNSTLLDKSIALGSTGAILLLGYIALNRFNTNLNINNHTN